MIDTKEMDSVELGGDDVVSPIEDDAIVESIVTRSLTKLEIWNLSFSFLAWACTICNLTLVIGTNAIVFLSIGGPTSMASVPLGTFILGASFISLTVTPWLFKKLDRKRGFLVGIALGMMGTLFGLLSVTQEIPALLIVATAFFGTATGIGIFWRFAAVEVVPPNWSARAVTLIVSGGVIAAFAGPESSRATRYTFGEDLEYLGVFMMTGVFNIGNIIFTMLVKFPPKSQAQIKLDAAETTFRGLLSIINTREFVIPMLVSACAWAIMVMPMSMVRVAMKQTGYDVRVSLTVVEIHFLCMYSPGFVTGQLIKMYGYRSICRVGAAFFFVACLFPMFLAKPEDEGIKGVWMIALAIVGIGWNCCFTSATVWITQLYNKAPEYKSLAQSANDFSFFLLAGAWIVSASYIYSAGGAGLSGWHTLIGTISALIGLLNCILVLDYVLEQRARAARARDDLNKPTHHEGKSDGPPSSSGYSTPSEEA